MSIASDNAIMIVSVFVDFLGVRRMTFGEVVQHYLDALGVSQSELARRMGTGRQTVNSIIKNKGLRPTLDTAIAIANALGVPLSEMVDMMRGE